MSPTNNEPAEIGLLGLGTMGANLALNIAEKGFRIAVFNRTTAKTRAFFADLLRWAGKEQHVTSSDERIIARLHVAAV